MGCKASFSIAMIRCQNTVLCIALNKIDSVENIVFMDDTVHLRQQLLGQAFLNFETKVKASIE